MTEIANTRPAAVANPVTGAVDLTALHEATRETLPATPLPQEVAEAWQQFPALHGTVRIPEPGTPTWSQAETANAAKALQTARTLREAAKAIEDAVTEGHLTCLDIQAAIQAATDQNFAERLAKLPRTRKNPRTGTGGHYLLGQRGKPVRTPVPGTDLVLSAEYRLGDPQLSIEALNELRAAGALSRRELNRLTRTIRVVDTEAVTKATATNTGLRDRLRAAWKYPTPSISVHVRQATTA